MLYKVKTNLRVKNARQSVQQKIFNMFRSGTQRKQTNIDTHTHTQKEINKVKVIALRIPAAHNFTRH